ncbi:hypothetical protein [Eikenella corrodens]|jgi:hemagglutinin/hemolysin family protein|uniref:Uncharacterized protein n=1 Tax=Eikenella corrodens TaxID=539 RepID=A0A1A9RQN4_EIKCO|nr:hypothetical protein [Eikenella corrodens]OAM21946.1 hypothetical protein A7P90_02260 [Eikenella corrodens]OAM32594.1 hypothetical protein A7P93_02505 [Eikenella corrodens]
MTIDRLKNGGIKGAHNRDAFLAELNRRGGRVESETPTAAHGISQIKYEVPRVDRTGKLLIIKLWIIQKLFMIRKFSQPGKCWKWHKKLQHKDIRRIVWQEE